MSIHPHRHAGFTLIELMTVIVIAGVLIAVVVPNMSGMIANYRVKTASQDFYLDMVYARSEAIKRNADVTVQGLPGGANGWEVYYGSVSSPTILHKRVVTDDDVTIKAVDTSTNPNTTISSLSYSHTGRLSSGGRPQVTFCYSKGYAYVRVITVDPSGHPNITQESSTTCP